MSFDVIEFYERKAAWSREVFGPKQTPDGVIAHLRSELKELRAAIDEPDRQIGDVAAICEELADICLLAIDLSWRAGGTAADFRGSANCTRIVPRDAADYIGRHLDSAMPPAALAAVVWDLAFRALGCDGAPIEEKFAKIKTRKIPDWRTVPADQPIEHVREPVTVQVNAAASDPARVAAEVAVQFAALSEAEMPWTLSERLPGGAATARRVAALISRWRERAGEAAEVRYRLHQRADETLSAAVARVANERDALSTEMETWRDDSRSLRAERQRVREVLGAQPNETVEMAARRVAAIAGGKS